MESKSLNIYQRMLEVQKKVTSVRKNEKVQQGAEGYKAVSHDDVAAVLHLPLAEAGIFMHPNVEKFTFSEFTVPKKDYVQRWYRTDIEIKVKWINADTPEDFIEARGAAFALDTSDKSFAKAYSMALKIVLLKVHLLESRDGEEERVFESESARDRAAAPRREKEKPKEDSAPPRPGHPSQDQLKRMFTIGREFHWTPDDIKAFLKNKFGIESSKDLTVEQYDQTVTHLQNRPQPKSEPDPVPAAEKLPPTMPTTPPKEEPQGLGTPPEKFILEASELFADLNGKAISEVDTDTLNGFHKFLSDEVRKNPLPTGIVKLLSMKKKIETYLRKGVES